MTTASSPAPAESTSESREGRTDPGAGLRARIWTACLALSVLGASAVTWLAASRVPAPDATNGGISSAVDTFGPTPWVAVGVILLAGVLFAIWLDGGIAGRLRRLLRAWGSHDLAALREASASWGEIGVVAERAHEHATWQREGERRLLELDETRQRIRALRIAIESGEPLEPVAGAGPLAALAARIDEQLAGEHRTHSRHSEAAVAAASALDGAFDDAQHSAEVAEKSFVEATALLTTVRELQRLGMELAAGVAQRRGAQDPAREQARRGRRDAVTGAFEELVRGSGESVDHLAAGLLRVQEIVDQVQRLANRATVIALNVVVEGGGVGGPQTPLADELRTLAREVRSATDRTLELSRELDGEVRSAVQRMHDLRGRVASRLESLPEPESTAPSDELESRLLERVREMIQDAASKTERLASTGERASRAAEHLVRRLDDRLREADARLRELQVGGEEAADATSGADGGTAASVAAPGLRVVDRGADPEDSDSASSAGEEAR